MNLAPRLESLAAPIGRDAFLRDCWRKAVFHHPGTADRLGALLEALGSVDQAALLARSPNFAVLGLEGDADADARLSVPQAIEAYENRGATLYFRLGDDAPLGKWTEELADSLGEPPIGVTSLFAVRGRHGTRLHLDWNENFTIQVLGTKRWRVARTPNDFVENPVTNWAIGQPAPLHAHASRLPEKMPDDAPSYLLTPGSVLYVPRGFLHEVASVDDAESLSLNMSFPPSPWGVILSTLLGVRLLENPEWREAISGAFGSGWGREAFLARLPGMMAAFARDAAHVEGDLREMLDDPDKLARYLARRRYPRL
ncbi:hypothetical protein BWI17_01515 [Betaproteobacteria bacterium GR16-43]|nr:hypothetical protein BWI17_01515 [Betaproteobacteria bacterium GR16-43]